MKPTSLILLSVVGLCLVGCNDSKVPNARVEPSASSSAAPTPKPDVNSIPANLKSSDAYAYFGLGNSKPIALKMTQSDGKQNNVQLGGSELTFAGLENGKPRFEVNYTGDLSPLLGMTTYELDETGLHNVKMTKGEFTGDNLEMPLATPVGKTWKTDVKYTYGGQEIRQVIALKIAGKETVKTEVGTYADAMVVTGTGTIADMSKPKDKPQDMVTKAWYVKDRGMVRQEIKLSKNGKLATSMVIEERKEK
jgi:hypothetical protein